MNEATDILIKGVSYGVATAIGFIAFAVVIHIAAKIKDWFDV